MRRFMLLMLIAFPLVMFAQDSTANKSKVWLGVLTLTEKYKNEKNWTAADQATVGEHFQRLLKLKDQGVVVLAGRTDYELNNADMMGLVIFYAADDAAAQELMMNEPAVKSNIMLAKVHPYGIAVSKCK